MRKVMIVEDEILVRTGLKSLLEWERHGYQIVGEARDGSEAREKIPQCRPDLILTDLKMEPEDGFALIAHCKKFYPSIKLIVLSNYNDYENVRSAMKMGASDYVFKLMVKPKELLGILDEVSVDIKEKEQQKTAESRKTILKYMKNNTYPEAQELEALFEKLPRKIRLEMKYVVVRIWVNNVQILRKREDFSKDSILSQTMESTIREILGRFYEVEVFRIKKGEFVALFNIDGDYTAKRQTVFKNLMQYIYQYCGVHVSAAVSREKEGGNSLGDAVRETENIKSKSFLLPREIPLEYGISYRPFIIPKKLQIESLTVLAEQGNIKEMLKRWEELLEFLEENRDIDSSEAGMHMKKMYIQLCFMYHNRNIEMEAVMDSNSVTFDEALRGYDTFEDLRSSVRELIGQYNELEKNQQNVRREVTDIRKYVQEHLQEDITVAKAAERVNMSPSYFSHIFKADAGMAFGEYVLQKRMNRAAQLLEETDMKINEVADAVGIDNPNYFSTRFKKAFHISPTDYKKR